MQKKFMDFEHPTLIVDFILLISCFYMNLIYTYFKIVACFGRNGNIQNLRNFLNDRVTA